MCALAADRVHAPDPTRGSRTRSRVSSHADEKGEEQERVRGQVFIGGGRGQAGAILIYRSKLFLQSFKIEKNCIANFLLIGEKFKKYEESRQNRQENV